MVNLVNLFLWDRTEHLPQNEPVLENAGHCGPTENLCPIMIDGLQTALQGHSPTSRNICDKRNESFMVDEIINLGF